MGMGLGLSSSGGGGISVTNKTVFVNASATGTITTLAKLLSSASTLSRVSTGSNANLTLSGANIQATSALGVGVSQVFVAQEDAGDGRIIQYKVTCTGAPVAPSVPSVTLTPGNGQISVAWTDGSNGGATITSHNIYVNGSLVASPTGASPYVITGLTNGTSYGVQVAAVNSVGEGALSTTQNATPNAFTLPTFGLAKANGDSRTANSGSRFLSGSTISIRHGQTGVTMIAYAQAVCGNKWIFGEGFQHAIGASSTQAQFERDKQTFIGTNAGSPVAGIISATDNPAAGAGTGAANDTLWSTGSDALASCLTQTGNHVFSASVSVNDTSSYYNTPNPAYQSLRTIAAIADAYGTAGKTWYVGNEFPRGDNVYQMESKTVTGGTCTATNTTNFQDGESFGAVGAVGVFASGGPRPLTKVASAPGQDQYTVTSGGVYTFGGTAPTTAYITYNATPGGGRATTSTSQRVVNEWMNSSASNFVSTINSVDYGIPGLQYNRPWVRVYDTFTAILDPATSSNPVAKPGTYANDGTQLHGVHVASMLSAIALKSKVDADYPSAPALDQRPTRNNWFACRGTGAGTTFTYTLPPSMRSAATGGAAPTLISINGTVIGKIDTTTGAITGTGITTGTHNFSTGAGSITFASASSMPANAQLWLEQDIGNYDYANMTEGTIGRNVLMNGLLDMAVFGTDWTGTNITTQTGTSSIGGVAGSAIPYGWTLSNTAMATAVTNTTATVTVGIETDPDGYNRFTMEAVGSHTGGTALQLGQTVNFNTRVVAGDRIMSGAALKYAKTATNGRTYGHQGVALKTSFNTSTGTRNFASGTNISITSADQQVLDGATGYYIDDQLVTIAANAGVDSLYRVTPVLDTTGTTPTSPQIVINIGTGANVPFAYKLGMGRIQIRRRNDLAAY